jgi:hypothetical protein
MRVVSLATDDDVGVHGTGSDAFFPPALQDRVAASMSLFGVRGVRRAPPALPAVLSGSVSSSVYHRATQIFRESIDRARNVVGSMERDHVPIEYDVLPELRSYAEPLLPDTAHLCGPWLANARLGEPIAGLIDSLGDGASAIIDERGVPLLGAVSAEERSPARSSVLELARAYTMLRQALGDRGVLLPHPRRCSILQREPAEDPAALLRDLGAVGSLMERPHTSGKFPALSFLTNHRSIDLAAVVSSLAPLYKNLNISAGLFDSLTQ